MNNVAMRRILSLDGGGIRGAFSASFLATIEQRLDHPVGKYFDLVAGTSTGGIIALALGKGMSAQEIVSLYETMGRKVFRKRGVFGIFRTKYDNAALRETLNASFADTTLAESRVRLVVPAYDVGARAGVLMKTPHCADYVRDGRRPLVEVALATAAAPTYFPIVDDEHGSKLVDGGIFANNPAVIATAEAVFKLQWPREQIQLLSVGTTRSVTTVPPHGAGLFGWRKHIFEVFFHSQDWMVNGVVGLALGAPNVVRVDPALDHAGFALDDVKAIPALIDLGAKTAEAYKEELLTRFFQAAAAPWVSQATAAPTATQLRRCPYDAQ